MLNSKRLIEMARKWQKVAALRRNKVLLTRTNSGATSDVGTSSVASRGHVVLYTVDGKRFMIPMTYLNHNIFRELFKMSEDEFGLPSDGPITMPCDAVVMDYVVSLLARRMSGDVERALLISIATAHCLRSSLVHQKHEEQQYSALYVF